MHLKIKKLRYYSSIQSRRLQRNRPTKSVGIAVTALLHRSSALYNTHLHYTIFSWHCSEQWSVLSMVCTCPSSWPACPVFTPALKTDTQAWERLAKGCYSPAAWSAVRMATRWPQANLIPNHLLNTEGIYYWNAIML